MSFEGFALVWILFNQNWKKKLIRTSYFRLSSPSRYFQPECQNLVHDTINIKPNKNNMHTFRSWQITCEYEILTAASNIKDTDRVNLIVHNEMKNSTLFDRKQWQFVTYTRNINICSIIFKRKIQVILCKYHSLLSVVSCIEIIPNFCFKWFSLNSSHFSNFLFVCDVYLL